VQYKKFEKNDNPYGDGKVMTDAVEIPGRLPQTVAKNSSSLVTLERELAYLVRMLEAVQRKRRYPLERAQYLLLELLRENGPQPVANLAERLVLDSSTVARQVASMEQQELIDRVPNPDDGRSTMVRATPQGLRSAEQMRDIRLGRIALLFDRWSETDRSELARVLGKLNGSLLQSISGSDQGENPE
jgi:DNA-binding MarR family transcriptional regulator